MKFFNNIVEFFRNLFGMKKVPYHAQPQTTEEPLNFLERLRQPSPGDIAKAKAESKRARKMARTLELVARGGFCTGHGDQYRQAA